MLAEFLYELLLEPKVYDIIIHTIADCRKATLLPFGVQVTTFVCMRKLS